MARSIAPDRMARVLTGKGLEIGGFQGPQLLPQAQVTYVDLLSRAEALRFFPEVPGHLPAVDPEVLCPADDLHPFPAASQDFLVGSHLLEHTENPLAALIEWHRVLRPGGKLYLGLPDMRGTFDRHRTRTTLEHLIGDFEADAATRRERSFAHYLEWAKIVNEVTDPARAQLWAEFLQAAHYPIHFHCWEPEDLPPVFAYLAAEQNVRFEVLDFEAMNDGYEFCYLLEKRA